MLRLGFIIGVVALILQAYAIDANISWQTMLFTSLVLGRMAVALAVRSEHDLLLQVRGTRHGV